MYIHTYTYTAPEFGWHYLSSATCLMRPRGFYVVFVVSKYPHQLLHDSPRLDNLELTGRLRQVVPPESCPSQPRWAANYNNNNNNNNNNNHNIIIMIIIIRRRKGNIHHNTPAHLRLAGRLPRPGGLHWGNTNTQERCTHRQHLCRQIDNYADR